MLTPALLTLLLTWPSALAEESPRPVTVGAADSPHGFGLGVILGLPTGLSGIYRPGDRHAIAAAAAWSIPGERLHLHVDYQLNVVDLRAEEAPNVHFPVYVGIGPRLQLFGEGSQRGLDLGVRIPVGLTILPDKLPIDAFVELVPVLKLYPETAFGFDAALGGRFYFL